MEGGSSFDNIIFTPKEKLASRGVILDADMYTSGRLYASQIWIKPGDITPAYQYVKGKDTYGKGHEPTVYSFTNKEGEACFLVGDSHHRTAVGLIEGKPITAFIEAELGMIPDKILKDPHLAMQRFAVLGIDGIWPFKDFVQKFVEVKINLGRRKK